MNIYVSNLSFNVTDEDLQDYFAEYGEVSSAKVIMDKFTGKSRGFAFVEMDTEESAKKAMEGLNGKEIEGTTEERTITAIDLDAGDVTACAFGANSTAYVTAAPAMVNSARSASMRTVLDVEFERRRQAVALMQMKHRFQNQRRGA